MYLILFFIYRKLQKQSPGGVFYKYAFKNFAKFKGKHLRRTLFFKNVAGCTAATQVLLCEFYTHMWTIASGARLKIETYFGRTSFLFATNYFMATTSITDLVIVLYKSRIIM